MLLVRRQNSGLGARHGDDAGEFWIVRVQDIDTGLGEPLSIRPSKVGRGPLPEHFRSEGKGESYRPRGMNFKINDNWRGWVGCAMAGERMLNDAKSGV